MSQALVANSENPEDEYWMRRALALAHEARARGEVPVGAVLIHQGRYLTEARNQPIAACDPTAHAEIVALRRAARLLDNYRLPDSTLYVTLEPCPMCAGALIHARIERLVFGAFDPRTGAAGSVFDLLNDPRHNHRITCLGGVLAQPCGEILRTFFRERRKK